jgi:hypothetical protein
MHDAVVLLGAALVGLGTWIVTNLIGKPILAIEDARQEAIRVAERHAFVPDIAIAKNAGIPLLKH